MSIWPLKAASKNGFLERFDFFVRFTFATSIKYLTKLRLPAYTLYNKLVI